ncbi:MULTISPECIES: hypothetical protein [Elizabethkingia]|uniref:Uncharacterized protein n=1 Tax=Elizabethkingia ursingii TaxID=1756150 RepID=A0AAJ3NEL6_9FLAO|nr:MULTISPECIES: hypothetical protein [Elizabethkingia]AQW92918.1 hypothetical protein BBD30_01280 [Elizabethkingia anophelis]AQX09792.1 hypothetical protein BBD34_14590 [Elizabethkingia ursingii]OPB61470.1 hypothetical protein BAS07_16980 [Elizabethkingia anophelis]OPB78672.1 hypothetical protein BAY32_00600 [Elizabethkingia ursingii]OPB92831.1 hypothetical protein BB021_00045 [Elizabethkingia ursingii]
MEHYFDLPVRYKNEDLIFRGRLHAFAYDYKFYIDINNQEIIFENDAAGSLRAVIPYNAKKLEIDQELLISIIDVLKNLHSDL